MLLKIVLSLTFVILANCQCLDDDVLLNNRCYKFVKTPMNYTTALNYCVVNGYYLATLDNVVVNNFVASVAQNEFGTSNGHYYIGLYIDYFNYYWNDGTRVNYLNFQSGYPMGNDHFTAQKSTGKWVSADGDDFLPFVCSRVPVETTRS